jgi:putative transposase
MLRPTTASAATAMGKSTGPGVAESRNCGRIRLVKADRLWGEGHRFMTPPRIPARGQLIVSARYRHTTRIKGFDYAAPGWYYATICTEERRCIFGEVRDASVILSEIGRRTAACWQAIPVHFPRVTLDAWILMPNHLHSILVIGPQDIAVVGAQHAAPSSSAPPPSRPAPLLNQAAFLKRKPAQRLEVKPGSLGAILRSFKGACTGEMNRLRGYRGPSIWQRNYHEHVIRNEDELNRIRQYIHHNPHQWQTDPENPNSEAMLGSAP